MQSCGEAIRRVPGPVGYGRSCYCLIDRITGWTLLDEIEGKVVEQIRGPVDSQCVRLLEDALRHGCGEG